jgi:hypothetical protein
MESSDKTEEERELERKFPHLVEALKALRDKPPLRKDDMEWIENLAKDLAKFKD